MNSWFAFFSIKIKIIKKLLNSWNNFKIDIIISLVGLLHAIETDLAPPSLFSSLTPHPYANCYESPLTSLQLVQYESYPCFSISGRQNEKN